MPKAVIETKTKGKRGKQEWQTRGLPFVLALLVVCCLMVKIPGVMTAWGQSADNETVSDSKTMLQIEYYQHNTCASCHPEEDFYQIAGEQLGDLKEKYPYEIYEYNTFHLDDKEKFEKRLQELGQEAGDYALPLVVVGDVCLSGLEEIESGIRNAFLALVSEEKEGSLAEEEKLSSQEETKEAQSETKAGKEQSDSGWKADLSKALAEDGESDSVVLYFSTYSCDDCSRVKDLLDELEDTIVLPDGRQSDVKIHEFNIMEADYVEMVQYLFSAYEVPSQKQQVPIVFYRDGYLSGVKEIKEQLSKKIQAGETVNDPADSRIAFGTEEKEGMKAKPIGSYLSLILTGLINGLNPCGMSMLLMLLAAAAVAGKGVWKIGVAYLAGKFAAYYAMGFGLYQILGAVSQELLFYVSRGLTWGVAAIFFVLAVMYLLDFVHARRQEYDKVRMQLPGALRKWNHDKIERISKTHGKWLLPAVAVLGVIISGGEFFCTGQVYLAAILYLMKAQEQRSVQTLAAFLVYVSAMCLPSLILVLVIEKTRNVIRASNAAVSWLPFIKLATALVFLVLALVLLVI